MATTPPEPAGTLASFTPAGSPLPTGSPTLRVTTATARIGQGPQNDIVLDDDTVSSSHARLEYTAGSWQLTDLGSKNGTCVNGGRIEPGAPVPLRAATPVAFGAVRLVFDPGEGVEPTVAAPPSRAETAAPTLADRRRFRLPVWLLLLIVLLIALVLTVAVWMSGSPQPADAVVEETVALLGFVAGYLPL